MVDSLDTALPTVLPMRISQLRRNLNKTQEDMANAANLPFPTYQALETRYKTKRFNPTLDTLLRVAGALNITLSELTVPPSLEEIEQTTKQSGTKQKRVQTSKRRV